MLEVEVEVAEIVAHVHFGVSLQPGQIFILFHPNVPMRDQLIFILDFLRGFFEPVQLRLSKEILYSGIAQSFSFLPRNLFFSSSSLLGF